MFPSHFGLDYSGWNIIEIIEEIIDFFYHSCWCKTRLKRRKYLFVFIYFLLSFYLVFFYLCTQLFSLFLYFIYCFVYFYLFFICLFVYFILVNLFDFLLIFIYYLFIYLPIHFYIFLLIFFYLYCKHQTNFQFLFFLRFLVHISRDSYQHKANLIEEEKKSISVFLYVSRIGTTQTWLKRQRNTVCFLFMLTLHSTQSLNGSIFHFLYYTFICSLSTSNNLSMVLCIFTISITHTDITSG